MPHDQEAFPLTVTPFEHFLLTVDNKDYPATLWVGLDFLGQIEREIFPRAIQECLEGYPRFQALISGPLDKKTSDLSWIAAPTLTPYIYWCREGEPLVFPKEVRIDLFSELGIRFFVQEGKAKTRLWIQVHHACCDGMGMIKLLEDLYRRYLSYLASDKNAPTHRLTDISKRFQSTNPPIKKRWIKTTWQTLKDISYVLYFHLKPFQLLAVPSPPESSDREKVIYPSCHFYTFDTTETQKLKLYAAKNSVSLNDLLLRDLFLSLAKWNHLYASKQNKRCFRIMVPVDLRFPGGTKILVKNEYAVANIDQDYKTLRSPENLLQKISLATKKIKEMAPSDFIFMKFLNVAGKIKGGIFRKFTGEQDYHATSLLSFIPLDRLFTPSGDASQDSFIAVGEQLLEKIVGLGTYQEKTPAIFNAISYRGQLTIAVHFDPKAFSSSKGKELLDNYVRQIGVCLQTSQFNSTQWKS